MMLKMMVSAMPMSIQISCALAQFFLPSGVSEEKDHTKSMTSPTIGMAVRKMASTQLPTLPAACCLLGGIIRLRLILRCLLIGILCLLIGILCLLISILCRSLCLLISILCRALCLLIGILCCTRRCAGCSCCRARQISRRSADIAELGVRFQFRSAFTAFSHNDTPVIMIKKNWLLQEKNILCHYICQTIFFLL